MPADAPASHSWRRKPSAWRQQVTGPIIIASGAKDN